MAEFPLSQTVIDASSSGDLSPEKGIIRWARNFFARTPKPAEADTIKLHLTHKKANFYFHRRRSFLICV